MASRRNSQIFCWLTQDREQEEQIPMPFAVEGDVSDMTEEQINDIVKAEAEDEKVVSFNRARENSIIYEALPEGFDAKQLEMSHPNTNISTMVDWLANRCAASMGLAKIYATGNPEDTNWRANQLFSFPAILEFQHDLEQVCDWVFKRFIIWGAKKGIVKGYMAEDIMDFVDWAWRGLDDIDEVAHQNGIKLALENNTKTYKEILGADWKEKLEQTAREHEWMTTHGITPPTEKLISGGQTEASKQQAETSTEV